MKKNKHGFIIIECIIYFCLLVILTTITFNWVNKTQILLKTNSATNADRIAYFAAQDLLLRELRSAPGRMDVWKKITDRQIIWQAGDSDISFVKEGNKLFRLHGVYNQTLQEWKEIQKNIIADLIDTVRFSVTSERKYNSEWVTYIAVDYNNEHFIIVPRNGIQ